MRFFENPEMIIDFFSKTNSLFVRRLVKKNTDDESFKKLVLEWKAQIEIYKPKKQLIDYSNQEYYISDKMQEWLNENLIKPALMLGMNKVAFLVSHNYFSQISIEKTMQKKEGSKFEIQYFDDLKKAENWLYND